MLLTAACTAGGSVSIPYTKCDLQVSSTRCAADQQRDKETFEVWAPRVHLQVVGCATLCARRLRLRLGSCDCQVRVYMCTTEQAHRHLACACAVSVGCRGLLEGAQCLAGAFRLEQRAGELVPEVNS